MPSTAVEAPGESECGLEGDEGDICVSGHCEPVPAPQRVAVKLARRDLDWNQHVAIAVTAA